MAPARRSARSVCLTRIDGNDGKAQRCILRSRHGIVPSRARPTSANPIHMDFRFSPAEEAFRTEIRDWLKDNLPQNWTGDRFSRGSGSEDGMNVYAEFARRLATRGWVAPHWPKEYGGLGLTVREQLIFNEAMAEGNAPIGYSSIGVGW